MNKRLVLALLSLIAIVANMVEPAFAVTPAAQTGISQVDPRYLAFVRSHPCGFAKTAKSTPAPNHIDDSSTFAAVRAVAHGYAPAKASLGRMVMIVISNPKDLPSPASTATVLAQATAPPSAATAAPSANASPAATDAAASAAPAPATTSTATAMPQDDNAPVSPPVAPTGTGAATPTPIPIPQVPPGGGIGSQIIEPTPRGSGSPTPNPLPTAIPSSDASTPIFLIRTSPPPIPAKGTTPAPGTTGTPTPKPSSIPTLKPNDVVTIADHLDGSSDTNQPSDLTGNVHIFYTEGQIVGDRAHYDGDHTIVVSGHTYLLNRAQDSILYGDRIAFDTRTRRATLLNGSGESTEGVSTGKLHYQAVSLNAHSDGVSHGDHANFTTCENGHAGYHVEARTIDVTPGDKLIARKAVVYLGPTAIFYIPLLVIPLIAAEIGQRSTSFLPLLGYNSLDGFFIKLRIGFGTSNTYYGYYRIEYFTKRGLGLGYTAYIGAKDAHRYTTIDSYTIKDHIAEERQTNVNIQDVETFTKRLRGQFGVNYVGDFGSGLTLPASENITGSLVHVGNFSTENLTFSRFMQGKQQDTLNIGLTDSLTITKELQQQFQFAYSTFVSPLSASDTFHIEANTHYFTKLADYNLVYDKTDYSSNPFGFDKLPEIQILPHIPYGDFKFGPQIQITGGDYTEQQNHFNSQRYQAQINEAVYTKVFGDSDFSANYNLTQDFYGTGDEKAFDQQNAALTTPIGDHIVNSVTYNEQHPIGPTDVPFQLFDHLSGGSHSAQDVFRFYNKDVYSLSLSDGTAFVPGASQSITYQLSVRPSLKSYVVVGGYYQPGIGDGFNTTNVQLITPFGKDTTLEFATNVDWKNHNRLEDKNIYLTKTVDQCYNILASYNQDTKQFSFNIVILAFPGQSAGFGFGGSGAGSPILPQSFAL